MTKTLSKDIRSRFRHYIEEGWTARATGRALKISPASAVRFRQAILQGKGLDAKPRGGHLGSISIKVPKVPQNWEPRLCSQKATSVEISA